MTPIESATQALAMERIYTRLFSRNVDTPAAPKSFVSAPPVDTWEPSSASQTLPKVTYSPSGGS